MSVDDWRIRLIFWNQLDLQWSSRNAERLWPERRGYWSSRASLSMWCNWQSLCTHLAHFHRNYLQTKLKWWKEIVFNRNVFWKNLLHCSKYLFPRDLLIDSYTEFGVGRRYHLYMNPDAEMDHDYHLLHKFGQ